VILECVLRNIPRSRGPSPHPSPKIDPSLTPSLTQEPHEQLKDNETAPGLPVTAVEEEQKDVGTSNSHTEDVQVEENQQIWMMFISEIIGS
jgi:hypothetical protein